MSKLVNLASKHSLSRIKLQCCPLKGKASVTFILRLKVSLWQLERELHLPSLFLVKQMERQLTALLKSPWLSLLSTHRAPGVTYQINLMAALYEVFFSLANDCCNFASFALEVLNKQLNSQLSLHALKSDYKSMADSWRISMAVCIFCLYRL